MNKILLDVIFPKKVLSCYTMYHRFQFRFVVIVSIGEESSRKLVMVRSLMSISHRNLCSTHPLFLYKWSRLSVDSLLMQVFFKNKAILKFIGSAKVSTWASSLLIIRKHYDFNVPTLI